MNFDYSKIEPNLLTPDPTDPVEIFNKFPRNEEIPDSLWMGQGQALEDWYNINQKNDILISMDTGSGKTLVGLLIATSFVNQRVENVLYLCSTIDLVKQTSKEAEKYCLPHSIRVAGEYSNNKFKTGMGFCITTYHAIFNGFSSIARNNFPGAIIFDDAHVAENIIRDSYTIRISSSEKPDLFRDISNLFLPVFRDLGIEGKYKDSIGISTVPETTFVPPRGIKENKNQLLQILEDHGLDDDSKQQYPFKHLKDHLESCAIVFSEGEVELSPPFLPSRSIEVLRRSIRRVYLSATLQSNTEFARAFGKIPDKTITPRNDAGNGERLIQIEERVAEDLFSKDFVKKLADSYKIIIAVPSKHRAKSNWSELGEPPSKDNFTEELDEFRDSNKGVFVLVSRFDGIDLDKDTCRLMIMDGLPKGSSLIEKYQWDILKIKDNFNSRIATRIAQLFGRIIRGRNDFGVFLIKGPELHNWLSHPKNLSLLPLLLQEQIQLGYAVQKNFGNNSESVKKLIDDVISRSESWQNYYSKNSNIEKLDSSLVDEAINAEEILEKSAIHEAKFASSIWEKDYSQARVHILNAVECFGNDSDLAGWRWVWAGAAYDYEGDIENAVKAYKNAKSRLMSVISLPMKNNIIPSGESNKKNDFYNVIKNIQNNQNPQHLSKISSKLEDFLNKLGDQNFSSNKHEESVEYLGKILGFEASRPDNTDDTGPDVLWINSQNKAIAFELKTLKNKNSAKYSKTEISQGLNHISWVSNNFPDVKLLGMVFVADTTKSVDDKSNASKQIISTKTGNLVKLGKRCVATLKDYNSTPPVIKQSKLESIGEDSQWKIESIIKNDISDTTKDPEF